MDSILHRFVMYPPEDTPATPRGRWQLLL